MPGSLCDAVVHGGVFPVEQRHWGVPTVRWEGRHTMKRFFTILGLATLVTIAPPAQAQGVPGGGGLFRGITLTEQQRQQLDALHTTYQRDMQQIRQRLLAGDPEAEALRTQLRERQITQLRTVLDPEQAQA